MFLRNVGSHADYTADIPELGNIHDFRCENLKLCVEYIKFPAVNSLRLHTEDTGVKRRLRTLLNVPRFV
jgi:hypothetical protein